MQSNPDEYPIRIDSAVRFAAIGPGKPYPTIIVASDQGISDLIGYHALRELGMEKIIHLEGSYERDFIAKLFRIRKNANRESQAPIGSISVWVKHVDVDSDERDQPYSLVLQSNAVSGGELVVPSEIKTALETQLRSMAKAYRERDTKALRYAGQIMSTILSLIEKHAGYQAEQRAYFWRILLAPIALVIFTYVIFMIQFFHRSSP
jgi:hypothetical protein